jgi:hypothetical protein
MLLLRLSPIVPFAAINYVMAGTSISLRDYLLSLPGILPGTVAYVFIGTTAGNYFGFESDDDDDQDSKSNDTSKTSKNIQLFALCIGIFLALIATFLLSYHARQHLLRLLEERALSDDVVSCPPASELLSPSQRDDLSTRSREKCDMMYRGSSIDSVSASKTSKSRKSSVFADEDFAVCM